MPYKGGMRLGALALLVFLAGCSSDGSMGPTGPLDVQLVLAPGETANVENAAVRLRFEGVNGDSRCPADALCIWGGDALVRISMMSGGTVATYDLHTGSMQPARHGDLTIALVQLSPYPFSNRTIAPNEYRATLRVTR